jgi:PKD repeat protein
MSPQPAALSLVGSALGLFLLTGCLDQAQSPATRSDAPDGDASGESVLGPVDLVYLCGNKFLATNSTKATVHVEYRVVGTAETGAITLRRGPEEDPGFSETEIDVKVPGTVELYRDGQRVTRRLNRGVACGRAAISASFVGAASPEAGSWTDPFPLPIVALHASLLPTGKVLMWGQTGAPQLWDAATGELTAVPSPAWVFCAGHSFLADGRLLVSGGHISSDHGIPDISIFTPGTETWSKTTSMSRGRWYPTNTMLANGDVVITAGRDQAGIEVEEPEVWSASTGAVRVLTGAKRMLPYYPRTFLAPNGKIFYAGEQQTSRYLDISGAGTWTTVGGRNYPVRDYGSAVMYDEGKILYVGGGRTTATAEIIDLNSAAPTWQYTGSMATPRRHLNATVLPDGQVLVTGGSSGTSFDDYNAGVHTAEIWDPGTGVWTTLASNSITRTYHATSLLLPDGRVLHTGSGEASGAPDQRNAEIFSPPYLFKGPRPTITDAPSTVAYGGTFPVTTPEADDIGSVSLIRLGSVTHAFDANQRFQRLGFARSAEGLTIAAPAIPEKTPPGHYMLFLLSTSGVPSVARIVRVGSAATEPPTNAPPVAAFSSTCTNLTCTFTDGSSDSDGTIAAWVWGFGDGASSSSSSPVRNYGTAGTYTVTLTVTDNAGAINQRSATVTVTAPTSGISLSATGRSDGTAQYMTLKWSGATGASVDIYRNGSRLRTTANDGSDTNGRTFQGDATYVFRVCDAGTSRCSNDATVTFGGTTPPPNAAPVANFSWQCTNLTCIFADGSTDSDGTVSTWNWTFGDGSTSSERNPAKTYGSSGTFTVTLQVTDNSGAASQRSAPVTVSLASSNIGLTASGRVEGTAQYMTLKWTGAVGPSVDVYRNGTRLRTTANDGSDTNGRTFQGAATYVFRVCQAGTTVCSNDATVVFK